MSSEINVSLAQPDVLLRSAVTDEDIELRGEMRIGRERDCEVQLDDSHISRYHAKISVTPEGILLEDLSSTNGTYVNGIRIQAPQLVSVGDELRFHHCLFRLVSNQSSNLDATVFGWPVNPDSAPPSAIPAAQEPVRRTVSPPPVQQEVDAPIAPDPLPDLDLEQEDLFPASANDFEPVRKRTDRPSAIERQMRKENRETEKFLQRVLALPDGVWLAFNGEEEDSYTLYKLAAKSGDGDRLFLVSDKGMRVFEKSSRELAQDLQFNRAHVLDKGPLLGRLAILLTGAERRARNGRETAQDVV